MADHKKSSASKSTTTRSSRTERTEDKGQMPAPAPEESVYDRGAEVPGGPVVVGTREPGGFAETSIQPGQMPQRP